MFHFTWVIFSIVGVLLSVYNQSELLDYSRFQSPYDVISFYALDPNDFVTLGYANHPGAKACLSEG